MYSDSREPLLAPAVLRADVQQEAEVARLLGKTPSKSIITKKLGTQGIMTFSSLSDLRGGFSSAWGPERSSYEATAKLIDWALTQSIRVQVLVFEFLENPDPDITHIVEQLTAQGVTIQKTPVTSKSMTATSVILQSLPATYESLVEAIRHWAAGTTKRPEATVRQVLRRLIRTGKVTAHQDGLYRKETAA